MPSSQPPDQSAASSATVSRGRKRPEFDIVIFGATSFVGKLICEYLLLECESDRRIRWAMAGRSERKLKDLRITLGQKADDIPLIVADAKDSAALEALCKRTRVVLSTVGPYALYGEPLIAAAVATGTDYCDLTGEVQWIRRMISRYEDQARDSGARIVHCCGFDSIPSDLGLWYLQKEAASRLGGPCQRVQMRVRRIRGGASGGTVASMTNIAQEAAKDKALRKELANPYSLCVGESNSTRQPAVRAATYEEEFDSWAAPFVMAVINTGIVHRSNFLGGYPWGRNFRYDEAMLTGKGAKGWSRAQAMTVGIGSFMVAAALKPTRWLLENFVLPEPGDGPSREEQRNGFFDIRFLGTEAPAGGSIRVKVTGDRDPGYGSTSKMIAQAALCMAKDLKGRRKGGFYTPSTLMGDPLLKRLVAHAGLTFDVLP